MSVSTESLSTQETELPQGLDSIVALNNFNLLGLEDGVVYHCTVAGELNKLFEFKSKCCHVTPLNEFMLLYLNNTSKLFSEHRHSCELFDVQRRSVVEAYKNVVIGCSAGYVPLAVNATTFLLPQTVGNGRDHIVIYDCRMPRHAGTALPVGNGRWALESFYKLTN